MIQDFQDKTLDPRILYQKNLKKKFGKIEFPKTQSVKQPKLYTVAQTLKDIYILKNLKPQIGSLQDFLNQTDQKALHLLAKKQKVKNKKKQQFEQDNQQKMLRQYISVQKKKPQEVLMKLQVLKEEKDKKKKQVAAKIIIENLFKQNFGETPQQFYRKNSINLISQKFYKIKKIKNEYGKLYCQPAFDKNQIPNQINQFLVGKKSLMKTNFQQVFKQLETELKNKKHQSHQENQHQIFQRQQIQSNNYRQGSSKNMEQSFNFKKAQERIQQIQKKKSMWFDFMINKYVNIDLKLVNDQYDPKIIGKVNFYNNNQQEKIESYEKLLDYREIVRKQQMVYEQPEIFHNSFVLFSNQYMVIKNIKIQVEMILYAMIEQINLQSLIIIEISNCQLNKAQGINAILQLLLFSCKRIQKFLLDGCTFKNITANLLQKLITKNPIKILILNNMGITSKQFCIISIGIGQNKYIEDIIMRKNNIDGRAIKSIQILVRYIKTLKMIDLSSNQFTLLNQHSFGHHTKQKGKMIKLL